MRGCKTVALRRFLSSEASVGVYGYVAQGSKMAGLMVFTIHDSHDCLQQNHS